jgi:hypothetical protein
MAEAATQETAQKDFWVQNHGTVFVFTALTDAAKERLREIKEGLDDFQSWGRDGIVVEHRYATQWAENLDAEGFTLEV